MSRLLPALAGLALLAGCQAPQPHNPNDPDAASAKRQPIVLHANVVDASQVLNARRDAGEITDEQAQNMLADEVADILARTTIKAIPDSEAWMVADAFTTARQWDRAADYLRRSLDHPTSGPRRVNDLLQLARAEAELGHPDAAIATARQSFDAPPPEKWPILFAVYLEIVPAAAADPGANPIDLARLVDDAVAQHRQATGDPAINAQAALLETRNYHIKTALALAARLYAAGRDDADALRDGRESVQTPDDVPLRRL